MQQELGTQKLPLYRTEDQQGENRGTDVVNSVPSLVSGGPIADSTSGASINREQMPPLANFVGRQQQLMHQLEVHKQMVKASAKLKVRYPPRAPLFVLAVM